MRWPENWLVWAESERERSGELSGILTVPCAPLPHVESRVCSGVV